MRPINVLGLNAYAPMPQMLRERGIIVCKAYRNRGEKPPKCYAVDFPVTGGWGYTQEDACIFEFGKDYHPDLEPKSRRSLMESDIISLEHLFVERRVYAEILLYPLPGLPKLGYGGLVHKWRRQALVEAEDGRVFDKIEYHVGGYTEEEYGLLQEEFEKCNNSEDKEAMARFNKLSAEKEIVYDTVCWFDISCCRNLGQKKKQARPRRPATK